MALRPQVILFGDSITQRSFQRDGWGASMADRYFRTADVVLRGYSGYNTRWALHLLEKVFPIPTPSAPLLVTIFFGANDAALPERGSGSQHVPVLEFKENLHKIIARIKNQSSSTHIVIITPPPICEKGRQAHARLTYGDNAEELPERTNAAAEVYAQACEIVGKEAGVRVLNIWSIFQETPNWQEEYLNDGLHLSDGGNRKVFKELAKLLDEGSWVPSLKPEDLSWDFPCHTEIDADNPCTSFLSSSS